MDNFAYSEEVVRTADRDRYLADLFAPAEVRPHLLALHAFNVEVGRIAGSVSEASLGEIRLQWWRDAITLGDAAAGGNPVAAALRETMARYGLPEAAFLNLLEARTFDLYNDQMPTLADLEGYAGETSAALMQLGAMILSGAAEPATAEAAGLAGVAHALTAILREVPRDAARRRCYLPADITARHGLDLDDLFAGRTTEPLRATFAEIVAVAQKRLEEARAALAAVERPLMPAFLPAAVIAPQLAQMAGADYDPLHSTVRLGPLRRQWLIWRAARRGRL